MEIILPPGIFEELLFFAWVFRAKGIKLDQVILKPTVGEKLLPHPYVVKSVLFARVIKSC